MYILMGLPTETLKDYFETVSVARQCEPAGLYPSIFYPYPGTHLFNLAAELKLFDPAKIRPTAERSRAYLELPGFSKRRIWFEYLIVHYRIFRGRWPLTHVGIHAIMQFLGAFPSLQGGFHSFAQQFKLLKRLRNATRHTGNFANSETKA